MLYYPHHSRGAALRGAGARRLRDLRQHGRAEVPRAVLRAGVRQGHELAEGQWRGHRVRRPAR